MDVLVSFDGKSPHCITRSEKCRSMAESESDSQEEKGQPMLHPKVNLPFFRRDRDSNVSKLKIVDKRCDESLNDGSTQGTERNLGR